MPTEARSQEAAIIETLASLTQIVPAGFALALHVRYQTPTYLFQTYPPSWREEYSREGLVMSDPIVAWGFGHTGVVTWGELARRDPAGVFDRARGHGLSHGLALSMERDGSRSFAGFAHAARDFTPDETRRIVGATEDLHDRTASKRPLSTELRAMMRRLSVAFTHS